MSLAQQAELITLLAGAGSTGLTSNQLFDLLTHQPASLIPDRITLSTLLYDLRSHHAIVTDPYTCGHHLVSSEPELCELACLEKELNPGPSAAELASINLSVAILNRESQAKAEADFALAEPNAFEKDLILMAESRRTSLPRLFSITHKAEKIALLNRLAATMNEDIKALLDDVRHDLMQLEAS